ncbi:LLM class flavin-dependent oxidoreductase [Amycolatopsis sp. lyj-90]|uniref:LLM class flavin-dependent oxidoreductase n=1 Tax=Amycolatopsis sp. lyj-90 TaxID=2789285 RepID=UPI00397E88D3
MEFGLNFFPVMAPGSKSARQYYDETLRLSRLADTWGYEHVQTVEHYGSGYGGYSPDPVTLLTAMAMATTRIRITTGAVIPAFTHPLKLAGKLAMLDNLSGGRLDVGFGRGFLPDEFDWFGVPMAESRERFDEGLEACRRLWSEENVVFSGKFSSFGPVSLLPRPVQQPHPPIFVASATSPDSCATAGTAGYHLQVVPSVTSREQLTEMLSAYRSAWASAGHPAGGARIQIKYTCYVDTDGSEARERASLFENNYIEQMTGAIASWATTRSEAYPGYEKFIDKVKQYSFENSLRDNKVLAGTPEEVADRIAVVGDWFGDDLCVSLQFSPGYQEFEDSRRSLELFTERVMPEFTK